jgi:hypothetical protein
MGGKTRQRAATVVQSRSLRFLNFSSSHMGRLRHNIKKMCWMENVHAIQLMSVCGCQNSASATLKLQCSVNTIITATWCHHPQDHTNFKINYSPRRCYPHKLVYLASATSCLSKRSALTFQGNFWLWWCIATRNSSLKILPDHSGPNSMVTLPGKLCEHPHPSKDDGNSETKNYTHKNIETH